MVRVGNFNSLWFLCSKSNCSDNTTLCAHKLSDLLLMGTSGNSRNFCYLSTEKSHTRKVLYSRYLPIHTSVPIHEDRTFNESKAVMQT